MLSHTENLSKYQLNFAIRNHGFDIMELHAAIRIIVILWEIINATEFATRSFVKFCVNKKFVELHNSLKNSKYRFRL